MSIRDLVNSVTAIEAVQQRVESSDLKTATTAGDVTPALTKYTASNLTSQGDDDAPNLAGTQNEFAYPKISTTTLGYGHGDSYTGSVAGLARQFIWNSGEKIALAARTNNVFLHGGARDDALNV